VAIPAKNEAAEIAACLTALSDQRRLDGAKVAKSAFKVFLLINNTTDGTAAIARRVGADHDLGLEIMELNLGEEKAHAGGARRRAMDWAAQNVAKGGVICTTDADSIVSSTWLAQIWRAIGDGADAVAGVVQFDPSSFKNRPFPAARRMEARYAALQAEVMARMDPRSYDPWPNHIWTWGANLAVTADAYRAVGGLPEAPLAEDRALAAVLELNDFKIRHALAVRVQTSRRESGRAPGGLADLVRRYAEDEAAPCDAELEPILDVLRRAAARRRLLQARDGGGDGARMARRLGLPLEVVQSALARPRFGEAWRLLETASPRLAKRRLYPHALAEETQRAERILRVARPTFGVDPAAAAAAAATAGLWSALTPASSVEPAPSP
jgi:glycosyltransferase involved in cell wall biosynthesis